MVRGVVLARSANLPVPDPSVGLLGKLGFFVLIFTSRKAYFERV